MQFLRGSIFSIFANEVIKRMLRDFLSLFFPRVCECCGTSLNKEEDMICAGCVIDLPVTNYHRIPDNPVSKLFWGRFPVQMAAACYTFTKNGPVQRLVHRIKYKGKKELGKVLGRQYGYSLMEGRHLPSFDLVIPVPAHPDKLSSRGFNQSEWIAFGIAEAMKLDCVPAALVRRKQSGTQTNQRRFDRWKNVKDDFAVVDPELIRGKHILLIDDVVTTGATLEACSRKVLEVEGAKVSILTLAHTQ